ncbi:hypothetical protein CORC01_07243 [Colletotrichum orchidophilum]|uniref:Uncharacterized protein n=1 Tax=Colletotrichum orchidophilum TaxID=1209926 RepID=A0A1G4B7R3_9PEZI|nr:uncharacterized protein CORC01_07243 [Colletotrichum orchidophilum]OHE97461.1 hypothetical protein CORC01_07243 [Colletotrichum orchidophilum]
MSAHVREAFDLPSWPLRMEMTDTAPSKYCCMSVSVGTPSRHRVRIGTLDTRRPRRGQDGEGMGWN